MLAEVGIAIPVGLEKALKMARENVDGEVDLDLPAEAVEVVTMLSEQILQLHLQLRKLDLRLAALQRNNETARRLATIPGIGPVGATAIAASVTDPGQFASGRQFAAWLGLTPRQNSSGGKECLGRITNMCNKYLGKPTVTVARDVGHSDRMRFAGIWCIPSSHICTEPERT